MTLNALAAALPADVVCLPDAAVQVAAAYTSDLLSDVMAHAPADSILITVQNHRNTVAVATLVNARAILVCHGREIPADMDAAARSESVALLRTPLNQFEASCRLGALLPA
jgi:hypothetical protein